MTAFDKAQIPATVNSAEKLAVWVNTLLADLYRDTTVIEASGVAERVAQSSPFLFTATNPSVWRAVSRTSIQLDAGWRRTGKLWIYAQDIGTLAIPSDYST